MTAQCWVHVPRCAVGDAQGTGTLRRRRSLEKSVCGRESERVAAEPGGADGARVQPSLGTPEQVVALPRKECKGGE